MTKPSTSKGGAPTAARSLTDTDANGRLVVAHGRSQSNSNPSSSTISSSSAVNGDVWTEGTSHASTSSPPLPVSSSKVTPLPKSQGQASGADGVNVVKTPSLPPIAITFESSTPVNHEGPADHPLDTSQVASSFMGSYTPELNYSLETGFIFPTTGISASAVSSRATSPIPLPAPALFEDETDDGVDPRGSAATWDHQSDAASVSAAGAGPGPSFSPEASKSHWFFSLSQQQRQQSRYQQQQAQSQAQARLEVPPDDADFSSTSHDALLGNTMGNGRNHAGRKLRRSGSSPAGPILGQGRGLKRAVGWVRRRLGYGAVAQVVGSAINGVSGPEYGPIRLGTSPPKRKPTRRRSRSEAAERPMEARRSKAAWKQEALRYVPMSPWSILLTLSLLALFAVTLTFSLIYILDPDKTPLPWRNYCDSTFPEIYAFQFPDSYSPPKPIATDGPGIQILPPVTAEYLLPINHTHTQWPWPGLQSPPATATAHNVNDISPVGVFVGIFSTDQASERRMMIRQTYASHPRSRLPGTESVRLRFILGKPQPKWEKMVRLEMETYNDIVILDTPENMNSGKTHAFFSWAAKNASVPIAYRSHLNASSQNAGDQPFQAPGAGIEGVLTKRPDYVVKADDDSFLMLGELERHLRVSPRSKTFWGYLVKGTFMAGECYALSMDLVNYVAQAPELASYRRGAEDKLVAKWMRMHPERESILWVSQRCWIYDHPKAGTVYSHGYIYPSTIEVIHAENLTDPAFSTVAQFRSTYKPPRSDLTPAQEVEALVEGSELSKITSEDSRQTLDEAWERRPDRAARFNYDPREYGGTVVVHFIKRHDWFMETALALLGPNEGFSPQQTHLKKRGTIGRDMHTP